MAILMHYVHRSVKSLDALRAFANSWASLHLERMGMKDIREARGLTHRDLADMIGMAQSTVTRAENHAKTSKLATYIKIAAALDVSLADLFADNKTTTELALLSAFRKVPEYRHAQWVQILQAAAARDQSESAPSIAIAPRSDAEVPH